MMAPESLPCPAFSLSAQMLASVVAVQTQYKTSIGRAMSQLLLCHRLANSPEHSCTSFAQERDNLSLNHEFTLPALLLLKVLPSATVEAATADTDIGLDLARELEVNDDFAGYPLQEEIAQY